MKRWIGFITLALAALLLLAACSSYPIGTPSAVISISNQSLTQDQKTGNWKLEFQLEARTLPGSPGGVILEYKLDGGGGLSAGRRIERCPATESDPCGPFTTDYTLEFTSYPPDGSFVVVGYTVMGENGAVATISLPAPLRIH
jgi:hypothetical protein